MSSLGYAADLPSRAVAPAPVYLAPAFTWTGFYVGGNVGAAWGGRDNCPILNYIDDRRVYTPDSDFLPNCNGDRRTGVIGGVQAGYNWQFGGWLFGVECDINWLGRNNGRGYDFATFGDPETRYMFSEAADENRMNNRPSRTTVTNHVYSWSGNGSANTLGTIRARFGFTTDRTLFFLTGGVAFRNGDNGASVTDTKTTITTMNNWQGDPSREVTSTTFTRSGNGNNVGWALGGGLEYALTENLSTKLEYLHAQFGNGDNGYNHPDYIDCKTFLGDSKNSVDILRVGLNYRFTTAAPAPVLARY
jgi:outer membrane immunogenic protein